MNEKLRADDLAINNWPKDEKNTYKYFYKMEKDLRRKFSRYYNRKYPNSKSNFKFEEEAKERYRDIEEDLSPHQRNKLKLKTKTKSTKIQERLMKAFKVSSNITILSDSIAEENSGALNY